MLFVLAESVTLAIMFAVHADVIAVFGENIIVLVPSALSVLEVALSVPHRSLPE
jgi:L-cystine uptake protein TcyP (sodium:dicarboxylate symporter family)